MARYVEGLDRRQSFLLPERIQNYVGEDNPVRVIDVFIDRTDLSELGFGRVVPADTSRAGHHPATLLKLYCMATSTASLRVRRSRPPYAPVWRSETV
jgi:transposase